MIEGTPVDLNKLRSIGVISRRHSRPQVTEGRQHPESGRPWKRTEDEAGIVTEHNTRDDRVDATAKVETIRAYRDPDTGRVFNA
jgi:hypothetical protein